MCKKLKLLDLKPTTTSIQFVDCSTKQPAGILEDIPVQVDKFLIPCDFIVSDTDEDPQFSVIMERPFLATVGQ